jgi:hypothetical protein
MPSRLVKGWQAEQTRWRSPSNSALAVEWFSAKLKQAWNEIEDHYRSSV